MPAVESYPVRVEGALDPGLSRWQWLVKWLLVIPHVVVLVILWIAFAVVGVIAFFSIVFTGRYPRPLFDFNTGVLRWSWRVGFYSFSANGTDRYPPFTLAAEPDYPATLEIPYPEHLSRGLALVKWWLLALPHYVVLGVFVGGGAWAASEAGDWRYSGGLVVLLVLIAAVALLFTGRYPQGIFDLVLGLDRWVLRVAAYASLMTDAYPPFRLDLGGREPGGSVAVPGVAPPAIQPATGARRRAPGRVLAVVGGALVGLVALALVAAGGTAIVLDRTQRDDAGYLMTPTETFTTATYALATSGLDVSGRDGVVRGLLGSIRIRSDSATPVFVGIAPTDLADAYLAGVEHAVVSDLGRSDVANDVQTGAAPAAPPTERSFWVASTVGAGEQTLRWSPRGGTWSVVVMNADASAGVTADLSIGAEVDALLWAGIGVLVVGLALGALAGGLLAAGLRER